MPKTRDDPVYKEIDRSPEYPHSEVYTRFPESSYTYPSLRDIVTSPKVWYSTLAYAVAKTVVQPLERLKIITQVM